MTWIDLLESSDCQSFCRSVWTGPESTEVDAPRERIIHVRGVNAPGGMRLHRVGVRLGDAYMSCGSVPGRDWIRSLRLSVFTGETWEAVFCDVDVQCPSSNATRWFDLDDVGCTAVLVEIRRAGVDDWWTPWNLAMSGLVIEGSSRSSSALRNPRNPGAIQLIESDSHDPHGDLTVQSGNGEARFSSKFIEVGFSLTHPRFTHLTWNEQGLTGREPNLLRTSDFALLQDRHWRDLGQGTRLHAVGEHQRVGAISCDAGGTITVSGNSVRYELVLSRKHSVQIDWHVFADGLTVDLQCDTTSDFRAWNSSIWNLCFDGTVSPTTLLGDGRHLGQTGCVGTPAHLHAPGYGTMAINSDGSAYLRADAVRSIAVTAVEIKLGDEAERTADYRVTAGQHRSTMSFRLTRSPKLGSLGGTLPEVVEHMLSRNIASSLPFRQDTATYSNNGLSIHAPLCMDVWAQISSRVESLWPQLGAMRLLRQTLDRWLNEGPGYATGANSAIGDHGLDDEYLLSGAACIHGLATYLDVSNDLQFFEEHSDRIHRRLRSLKERDLDGDGLIESPYRRGNKGEGQWGTNWFDAVSFGWKDAFSNAVLFDGLNVFARWLGRSGYDREAKQLGPWSELILDNYFDTFFNHETGWLGGWRSADGQLHDHGFLFVNGAAVSAGLLDRERSKSVMKGLMDEFTRVGFKSFGLGIPGNLRCIPDEDLPVVMRGLPFPSYLNGAATLSQARHFIAGLLAVGMRNEAESMIETMAEGLASMSATGGIGSGVDWRCWDGTPSGYEGHLCDQFGLLCVAVDHYQVKSTGDPRAVT